MACLVLAFLLPWLLCMWPGKKQGSWASGEGASGCWGEMGWGSLSPSCYKQGPPVCRLFQWGTEMNSMGGHGTPSQASACTTPPQSWGGPAICAHCLRRGIASPFLFYTPLHTHMHNYKKDSSQGQGRMKAFPQGGGDPTPLCLSVRLSVCLSPSLSILIKKGRIYVEAAFLFLCCWLCPALPPTLTHSVWNINFSLFFLLLGLSHHTGTQWEAVFSWELPIDLPKLFT